MKPKFSICIFTYNRAEYLKDSIKSALNQIYKDYEIVIVDDGSTDNTSNVVASFNSDKIRYFKKEHSGAPKTRNRAIDEALGEYIVWLADDDMLLPAALQYYSLHLEAIPTIDILYSHLRMFNNDSDITTPVNATDWFNKNDEALAFLLKGSPVTDGGCAVRKKVYEEVGKYNEEFSRAQDYEFWCRVVQRGNYLMKLVPKYLYLYRIHNSNITGKFNEKTDFTYEIKILEDLVENNPFEKLFPQLSWSSNRSEALFNANYFLSLKHFYIKSIEKGIDYLEKAKAERELSRAEKAKLEEIINRYSSVIKEKIFSVIAYKNSKNNLIVKYDNAIAELEKGNYELADNELEDILNLMDEEIYGDGGLKKSDIQVLQGNIALLNKNFTKAGTIFENVLENEPSSSAACFGLGEILLSSNDAESAKIMYEWALKNDVNNSAAAQRLSDINSHLGLPLEHNSLLMVEEEKN